MIVYLDLDRTIFQTARAAELWQEVAKGFPDFDAELFHAERSEYYVHIGDMYYHDVSAQLTAAGYDPEEIYEYLRTSSLADGRLQFDGAEELVRGLEALGYTVRVLTFGATDYQVAKASLCPALLGLDIVTTLRPKAEFIDDAEEECWLVDDKPIGDELSGLASFVQVSLESDPSEELGDWPVFYSLHDVKEFFDGLND